MIMISDITLNNYTEREVPVWMNADHYDVLLSQKTEEKSFLNRLSTILFSGIVR